MFHCRVPRWPLECLPGLSSLPLSKVKLWHHGILHPHLHPFYLATACPPYLIGLSPLSGCSAALWKAGKYLASVGTFAQKHSELLICDKSLQESYSRRGGVILISRGHQDTWWVWVYWGSSSDPSVGRVALAR